MSQVTFHGSPIHVKGSFPVVGSSACFLCGLLLGALLGALQIVIEADEARFRKLLNSA